MATDVLTIRQVAAEVGLTRQAVALAIRDGRLTASVVVGKHRRCTRAEVDAWLARRQQVVGRRARRKRAEAQRTAANLDVLYDFIVKYKRSHGGRCPTAREMAEGLGVPTSVVSRRLGLLEADGRIILERSRSRGIIIPGERWLAPGEGKGKS